MYCSMLNQYAHCTYAARHLTCSVNVKIKKINYQMFNSFNWMYVRCWMVNMLIGHECPLLARAVYLVCVQKKKGNEFGEIGRSEAAWPQLCLRLNSDDAILMQNAVYWFGRVLRLAMFWAAQYFPKYAHKLELAGLYNKMLISFFSLDTY